MEYGEEEVTGWEEPGESSTGAFITNKTNSLNQRGLAGYSTYFTAS